MPISLVTGGAGFIGSHVVDELLRMDHEVVTLDDLSGGFNDNVNHRSEFVCGSILDESLVRELFEKYRFDYVFHLAAYAAEGLSHFIKSFNYRNNLLGSVMLVNAAVNTGTVKCFVFTSSIAVYGDNQLPMREELVPAPADPYGIAKYAVELDLRETFKIFGLPYIIFRPHNVYGERQNIADRYRNVIGIFMNRILRKERLQVFGSGEQTRAFSYIEEVAPVIARSVERREAYQETFNIGADQQYSLNELIQVISEVMGVSPEIEYLSAREEVLHAYASHAKVNQCFGNLVSRVPLREGLRRMAQWVIEHGSRESTPFSSIEVSKNLPGVWVTS
jgi:UDP-glucose 4-epimerase